MKDGLKLIETEDGSHTFYLPELDEHYHSTHGAIQEALHVFINAGLRLFKGRSISIFEMGLGTGLNALLTCLYANRFEQNISYFALEKFPLHLSTIAKLNYIDLIDDSAANEVLGSIQGGAWENEFSVTSRFCLTKIKSDLLTFSHPQQFDLIYYDAFGPRVQPELWEVDIFEKLYGMLNKGGIVVTYCAKGTVKRGFKEAGFEIESLPGPPGKREMTRAWKR